MHGGITALLFLLGLLIAAVVGIVAAVFYVPSVALLLWSGDKNIPATRSAIALQIMPVAIVLTLMFGGSDKLSELLGQGAPVLLSLLLIPSALIIWVASARMLAIREAAAPPRELAPIQPGVSFFFLWVGIQLLEPAVRGLLAVYLPSLSRTLYESGFPNNTLASALVGALQWRALAKHGVNARWIAATWAGAVLAAIVELIANLCAGLLFFSPEPRGTLVTLLIGASAVVPGALLQWSCLPRQLRLRALWIALVPVAQLLATLLSSSAPVLFGNGALQLAFERGLESLVVGACSAAALMHIFSRREISRPA